VKILVADAHAMFREGLRHVLKRLDRDVQMLEAGDFRQILEAIDAHPDVVLLLLDLDLPGPTGRVALEVLTQRYFALPIVVLSGSAQRNDARRALRSGAMGFVPKAAGAAPLLNALRLVLNGGVYAPPALLGQTD